MLKCRNIGMILVFGRLYIDNKPVLLGMEKKSMSTHSLFLFVVGAQYHSQTVLQCCKTGAILVFELLTVTINLFC